MLNDPVKRESIKALGATGAMIGGGSIAASLAIALGIAVEALGLLGEKRTKELFNEQKLIDEINRKVKESDNFASFVYDVWQKHNLESSKKRREYLKSLLTHETFKKENNFENFSKIEFIIQNASIASLQLLKIFNSRHIYGRPIDPTDARSRLTNLTDILDGLQKANFDMYSRDVEYHINELCNYDLIAVSHGALGGPFYNQTKLGFIILEYIQA